MSVVPAIHAEKLSKSYRRRVKQAGLLGAFKGVFSSKSVEVPAVRGLDFIIQPGEAVGLIGENGAGKSTTVKMLTGILVPSQGSVTVLGRVPSRERQKLAIEIGVVFGQRPQLLWDIAVRETFTLLKAMYKIPPEIFSTTSAKVVQLLDLEPLLDIPVRQLSLGQRMRCDLAAAFLHAPKIAFLDEPTIGLDVVAKEQARELIRFMNKTFGSTILLTTHDVKDITETCERVILLDKGGLLFDGSLTAFEEKFASERRLIADLEHPLPQEERAGLEALIAQAGGKILHWEPQRLSVAYTDRAALIELNRLLLSKLDVADFTLERVEVEEIVRNIYTNQQRERLA
ncbi:MAG: ATP-binding cassette domain-containing protein [candidate division FCPU426 bacterium]